MEKLTRLWTKFCAWPEVFKLAAGVALAIIGLLLWPTGARADSLAKEGSDWVRITALPCRESAVIEQIKAKGGDPLDYRAATSHFEGREWRACWVPRGMTVFLVYEDGDTGFVPVQAFKAVPEA